MRNRELMRTYRRIVDLLGEASMKEAFFELVVSEPASRFWISEERAYEVIRCRVRDEKRRRLREAREQGAIRQEGTCHDERREAKRMAIRKVMEEGTPLGAAPASEAGPDHPEGRSAGGVPVWRRRPAGGGWPMRKELYDELYRRFLGLREQYPEENMADLVRMVVMQPAPCFYLSPATARKIVMKMNKAARRKRQMMAANTAPSPRRHT